MNGDPFFFASGPEEAQACTKAGVGFEIVPGVSSATAVAAYAGVPLTTKNNREVSVVTCGDKVDWSRYADNRTLVLLSAVGSIGEIAKSLIPECRAATTPLEMNQSGTSTTQPPVHTTPKRDVSDPPGAQTATHTHNDS